MKANRAYILATTDTFGKRSPELVKAQKHFVEIVKKKLNEFGIAVIEESVDMFDPQEVIKRMSSIIIKELANKNIVYINISSAGRLTAAVALLVAMAHKVKAYYMEASGYSDNPEDRNIHGISICHENKPVWIENLPVEMPPKQEMEVLKLLKTKNRPLKINEIALHLARKGFPQFAKHRNALEKTIPRNHPDYDELINCSMKLNKGILEKLEAKGYIRRERQGRENLVILEDSGGFIANFCGN